jgi:hypothetical protein
MEVETLKDGSDVGKAFVKFMMEQYNGPLYKYLKENPHLISTFPGFLLSPDQITVYIGRSHIAIEYSGPEFIDELDDDGIKSDVSCFDYSTEDCNLFEKIIGFEFDSTRGRMTMPLPQFSEDLVFPTNKGFDKLSELKWNFAAQSSIMGFNIPTPSAMPNQFTRIVNGMFFDANENGLVTRRIKWLDMVPISFNGSDEKLDHFDIDLSIYSQLVEQDANYSYPVPKDYKYTQLPKINRFIEIWGSKSASEPQITSHLSEKENQFILSMKFGAAEIHSELTCVWQEQNKDAIRPDFFVVQPNGYADIVEFKLPSIDKNFIVGKNNRETFSAWIHSYIAQTRVYEEFFEESKNRDWFEEKYGFKVHRPKRYLVVGRRNDFKSGVWRDIQNDYRNIEILTFDDLIDGVSIQFYQAGTNA